MLKNMIELKISVCTESVSCFTLSKLPLILASSNAIPVDKNEITRTNKKKHRYIIILYFNESICIYQFYHNFLHILIYNYKMLQG